MNYTNKQKRQLVKEDYDAIADIYAKHYSSFDSCKTFVDEFASGLAGKYVLDLGCGAGNLTAYLADKGLLIEGIDFSEELLKIAKKQHPKIKFINADICDYSFDKKYDGIISKDALFHLPNQDLKEALLKCRKILKPNGKFCVIMDIPKEPGEHIFVEELDSRYKIYYNYLTSQKCESLLKQTGFMIKEMKVLQDNSEASSYASGLMVFSATNNQEVER